MNKTLCNRLGLKDASTQLQNKMSFKDTCCYVVTQFVARTLQIQVHVKLGPTLQQNFDVKTTAKRFSTHSKGDGPVDTRFRVQHVQSPTNAHHAALLAHKHQIICCAQNEVVWAL